MGRAQGISSLRLLPSTCPLGTADMRGMPVSHRSLFTLLLIFFLPVVSPGRFFAGATLKTMLAHIVTTYDIKLEENTTRPQSLHVGSSIGANPTAKVMFRKRACYGGAQ